MQLVILNYSLRGPQPQQTHLRTKRFAQITAPALSERMAAVVPESGTEAIPGVLASKLGAVAPSAIKTRNNTDFFIMDYLVFGLI